MTAVKAAFLDLGEWRTQCVDFVPWLEAQCRADVLERFREDKPDDWLSWFDQHASGLDGCMRIHDRFAAQLVARYPGIRVIHATRLDDPYVLRGSGLRAWSADELRATAQAEFASIVAPDVLASAIERCLPDHRGGRVYTFSSLLHALSMSRGSAQARLPSFTRIGGEFVAHVALEVGMSVERARSRGRAFLIACNIPWTGLDSKTRASLAEHLLCGVIIMRLLDPNEYSMDGGQDCISFSQDVPADCIDSFSDVEELLDRQELGPSDIKWTKFRAMA